MWILLIIALGGFSAGQGVGITTLEFDSLASCNRMKEKVELVERVKLNKSTVAVPFRGKRSVTIYTDLRIIAKCHKKD